MGPQIRNQAVTTAVAAAFSFVLNTNLNPIPVVRISYPPPIYHPADSLCLNPNHPKKANPYRSRILRTNGFRNSSFLPDTAKSRRNLTYTCSPPQVTVRIQEASSAVLEGENLLYESKETVFLTYILCYYSAFISFRI